MVDVRLPGTTDLLQVHVSDGMSQIARHLAALQKDYFNVDEMRFEQLLAQLQDYARLINIPDLDHNAITAATQLFADDELFIMGHILSMDLTQLDQYFERRVQQEIGNSDWMLQEQKGAAPLGLARLLDSWLMLLRYPQSSAGENLYSMIESVVIGFGKEFYPLIQQTPLAEQLPRIFSHHFISLIRQESLRLESVAQEFASAADDADVKSLYSSLLKSIEMVQETARKLIPVSMTCEYHDPAAAVRIAFVVLYQKLQRKLNRFTINYLDFYFNDVLKAKPQSLQPDNVYLVMKPAMPNKILELPAETEFFAGIDKNSQDIVYRSIGDVEINDAQIAHLHSLYFPSHPIDDNQSRTLVDACWLDTIPTYTSNAVTGREESQFYAFFGEQRNQQMSPTAVNARLGFAIASNVLLLREGRRKITVYLQYENLNLEGCSTLENKLSQLPASSRSNSNKRARDKAKFFAYFGNIFQLQLTTAEGWFAVPEYKPAYAATDSSVKTNCLCIAFHLPEDAPAITPFVANLHGVGHPTSVPILRFLLKDNYQQYPYDLLKEFVLKEIRIDVDVDGCRDLVLYNNIGQLSSLTPFAPFGPLPSIGSYFIVGCEETRAKQVTDFTVDIEWKGLPDINDGFDNWYKGYVPAKSTEKFVVSTSVLAGGKWMPNDLANNQRQELFATRIKNGQRYISAYKRLSTTSVMPFFKAQDIQQARKPFIYSPTTKAGLFKFMLQGPIGAFGHQEHQQILTNALTYNARVKHSHLFRPLPNLPYTPEISSISINYSASSVMTLADTERQQNAEFKDQFFHLHPMGWEKISPLRHPRTFQVPQYYDAGNLLIGLTASALQQLSLLFHLHDDSLPVAESLNEHIEKDKYFHPIVDTKTAVSWSYLSDNQWRKLESRQILSDSTRGFMRSGIVTLEIPDDITADNTLMPSGIYWLRIAANKHLKNFSHIFSVYTQAVKASWYSGEHPLSNPPMVLPTDTIKRTRKTLSGITGVKQIFPSFGGIPAETQTDLRKRISGRLLHKNRAITPRDYELLILEKFPQVYKVKCFANIDTQNENVISPGHLLIVPVPHFLELQQPNYQPHFDGYLILAIKEFVQQLASPFTYISVENPVYEEIQIRCAVHLKKGMHAGHYHNLLNQALCDFISPWAPVGNETHFGWNISEQDVKSFIHNLDYVDFVTDFSVLRIAPKTDGLFVLDDTAANATTGSNIIKPAYLWSIAVPIQHHYLETTGNRIPIAAEITGYDELEVGSTFIIS